jgi:hypothetical protein
MQVLAKGAKKILRKGQQRGIKSFAVLCDSLCILCVNLYLVFRISFIFEYNLNPSFQYEKYTVANTAWLKRYNRFWSNHAG